MTNNAFTVGLHIGSIVEQMWKLLCYMVFRLHYNVTSFKWNKENQSLVKVVTDTLYATTNKVSQVDIPSFLGTLRHFKGLIKRANSGLYQRPFQLYLCVSSWIFFCFHLPITLVSFLTAAGLPQSGVSHHGLCWWKKHAVPSQLNMQHIKPHTCNTLCIQNRQWHLHCDYKRMSSCFLSAQFVAATCFPHPTNASFCHIKISDW